METHIHSDARRVVVQGNLPAYLIERIKAYAQKAHKTFVWQPDPTSAAPLPLARP